MSAGRPGDGVPSLVTQGHLASSVRSGAFLTSLLTDPPQEVLDFRAIEDLGEIPDPEAEAYTNVGATTSLAIGLRQTTHNTLGSRSESDIGRDINVCYTTV